MDKSAKLYKKALIMYQNGEINKSIALCEKSMSCNLRNSSAINLKGLLYYFMGDMKNAKVLWLMNKQENKDSVSEKYLEDLKDDEERLDIYHAAVNLLEELDVNNALKLFEKCSESDFNLINVNNYECLCYIKKGEYEKAKQCINKVLQLDKHNVIAVENNKTLEEYGIVKKKLNIKPYAAFVLCAVVAVSVFAMGRHIVNNKKLLLSRSAAKITASQKKSKQTQNSAPVQKAQQQEVQQDTFPADEISSYINNKNYDGLYNDVMNWKDKNLQTQEKALIDKAVSVLKTDGSNYMYNTGMKLRNAGSGKEARDYFMKAYNFNSGTYLNEHITYMLGATSQSLGDIENQIKYYTEYINKYPEGTYAPTVYYELAMCYKGKNDVQSLSYAEKLHNTYPDSIYNNDKLKAILQQKK